jgi:hypothetical protein
MVCRPLDLQHQFDPAGKAFENRVTIRLGLDHAVVDQGYLGGAIEDDRRCR